MAASPSIDSRALPRQPFPWRGAAAGMLVLLVVAWSAHGIGFSFGALVEGWPQIAGFARKLMPWAGRGWRLDYLPEIWARLAETLKISVSAAVLGSAAALPFVLVGSQPLAASKGIYFAARSVLNLLRTIPDLVLAALLVATLGLGALPGLLALATISFGVVAKLLADAIETSDLSALQALEATGGSRLQGAVFAIWPAVQSQFWSFSLYALEMNVRVAAVLGLVGAGGIGQILYRDLNFFQYSRVGLIIAVTFVVVLIVDGISGTLREKLK